VPGYQILAKEVLDPRATPDLTPVVARTSEEVEQLLGVADVPHADDE